MTATNWDTLRAVGEAGFQIPPTADKWRTQAEHSADLRARAEIITSLLSGWHCSRLVSIGVGTGMLEHRIKVASPTLSIRCGDYASLALEVLHGYFAGEADVEVMNLLELEWTSVPGEAVLLHRVDMELRDSEWVGTFGQLARMGVEHVVLVPCGLLTIASAIQQGKTIVLSAVHRHRLMRNGWIRTPRRLAQLFSAWYHISDVAFGDQFEVWGLSLHSP